MDAWVDTSGSTSNVVAILETRHRQHLLHTHRNILAKLLEARMSAGMVELGENVGDGVADTGDFGKSALGDQCIERGAARLSAARE